ncbi:MAG: glycoside hydrolase family 43 protein [Flavobacterium sp.]|nr:glycoside hydrolase family 43 protein [Flavobacterium sp.]
MTATVTSGNAKTKKAFDIAIAYTDQELQGYLFTYFEGSGPRTSDEQVRFAASADAVNWFALNNNQPIIASEKISGTGGIRDPHILRGEDGQPFYMVATDMNTAKNGWGHNPGIVMLQSGDLINWEHSFIDLEKIYRAKFANIQWVWAPQTIYDPAADKYLVYFTVKNKDDLKLDFYSAYANKDFSGFENEPTLMFGPKYGAIDGDIIYKDGTYHFFFKGNTKDENGKETKNGIRQAIGKTLQGPWTENFSYLDAYSERKIVVEGSSIFKLNQSDSYVLMYDLYTNHRYEFQRSKDLYQFTPTPESFTKNFYPRHGSVIGITVEEAKRLNEKWGGVPEILLMNKNK